MKETNQWVVDRLEGDFAVCESRERKMREIPLKQFGYPPREGDVVYEEHGILQKDEEAIADRKKEMKSRFSKLIKK